MGRRVKDNELWIDVPNVCGNCEFWRIGEHKLTETDERRRCELHTINQGVEITTTSIDACDEFSLRVDA